MGRWWNLAAFLLLVVCMLPWTSADSKSKVKNEDEELEELAESIVDALETERAKTKRTLGKRKSCGGPLEAKSDVQILSSPRDDEGEYPENILCEWVITAPKGQNVHLHFTHFDLENRKWLIKTCNDYIRIFDGADSNGKYIGTYCVRETPPDVTSSGNQLFVDFFVDWNDERTGFDAEYTAVGGSPDVDDTDKDDDSWDTVRLEEMVEPTPDGQMPEVIGLKFLAHDQPIILHLQRNSRVTADTPVYVRADDDITIYDNPEKDMGFGLYEEVEQHAGFLVKTSWVQGKLKRSYFGTFVNLYLNITYTLEPLSADEVNGDRDYQVRRLRPHETVFEGDARNQPTLEEETRHQRSVVELGERLMSMRSKRQQGRRQYTVEMLLFIDYSIFNKWFQLSEERDFRSKERDAIDNIRFYFSHIVNGIDLRYQSINEPDYGIQVRLTAMYIARKPEDSPYTERYPIKIQGNPRGYTHAYKALDAFEKWLNESHHKLPNFDQATLYTWNKVFGGYRSDGSKRPISGLADIKGVCTYYGASINQDAGQYANMATGAHELGHNLGSNHDGTGNSCTGRDQYIMASSPGQLTERNYKNGFTFSRCSRRAFREFLFFLQMEGKNCLLNGASHSGVDDTTKPIGQRHTLDEQCMQIIGFRSYYCGGGNNDAGICRSILCYNPEKDQCTANTEQRAYEGTTCGDKKWCIKGDCVYDPQAPSGPDECVYGDFRGTFHDGRSCADIIREDPWECYKDTYSKQCCDSCARIRNPEDKDCEFGDKESHCKTYKASDCYRQNIRETCCGSCKSHLRENPVTAGCTYGDKASWCADIKAQQCYQDSSVCCETCFKLKSSNPQCKWGDANTWCKDLKPYQCYSSKDKCCEKCKQTGPPGCEFGDKNQNCFGVDCKLRYYQKHCCKTCAREAGLDPNWRPTTTTPPPKPNPPSVSIPADCQDKAEWCANMPPRDCYVSAHTCCATCARLKDNSMPKGCQFGDHVSWCASHVRDVSACDRADITRDCCLRCAQLRGTAVQPPLQPPSDCEDKASWCPNIHAGYCYDRDIREKTCCKTCSRRKTGPSGCQYGDKASWCRTMDRSQCSSNRDYCCYTCT